MGTPGYYRHEIKQGEDYVVDLTLMQPNGVPQDLTGCSFASDIRTVDGAIATSFVCSVLTPFTLGIVRLSLPAVESAKLTRRRFLHDLKQTDAANQISYPIAGEVIVQLRVTA